VIRFTSWSRIDRFAGDSCPSAGVFTQADVAILEKSLPEIRRAIEVVDVSTPATVIRYTGNWKGSMEGWAPDTHNRLPATGNGQALYLVCGISLWWARGLCRAEGCHRGY
jgi:hypothetical protein